MTDLRDALVALPAYGIDTVNHASVRVRGYTADQMREYAQACIHAIGLPGMVADAGRWRFLRRQHDGCESLWHVRSPNEKREHEPVPAGELDAAIDAAIELEASRG